MRRLQSDRLKGTADCGSRGLSPRPAPARSDRRTRPPAVEPAPPAFKEANDASPAGPGRRRSRRTTRTAGEWWKRYGNPELDALETRVGRLEPDDTTGRRAVPPGAGAGTGKSSASTFPTGQRQPFDHPAACLGESRRIRSERRQTRPRTRCPWMPRYEADVWGRIRQKRGGRQAPTRKRAPPTSRACD